MNTSQQNGHETNRGSPSADLQLQRMNGSIEPHVGPTAQGSTFSTSSPAPNAIGLLKALRRRWPLALICGLVAAGAAAIGTWCFLPPAQQMAYAKLYCPAKPEAILGQHPDGQPDFATFLKTQVALIKDRSTVEAALQKPEIMAMSPGFIRGTGDSVEWLAEKIKITSPDTMEIIKVSLERPTELEAKFLVKAITESYLEAFVERTMSQRRSHLKELKGVLKEKETELAERDEAIPPRGLARRVERLEDHLDHDSPISSGPRTADPEPEARQRRTRDDSRLWPWGQARTIHGAERGRSLTGEGERA